MLLAIDLGSTWCKVGYYDESGNVLASGRSFSRFGLGYGASGDELHRVWSALTAAVRVANHQLTLEGIQNAPLAIAVSCRGGTGVWLDRQWRVIEVPEIGNFGASFAEDEINEMYQSSDWGQDGPFAFSYAPATIGRLVWLRKHLPDAFSRVARAGALHDWIIYKLTYSWMTDPATGTGGNPWPDRVIGAIGLPHAAFPTPVSQDQIAGELVGRAADELGLPSGIPVIVGCHDGVAANIGCGTVRNGDVCITLGSNLVVRAVAGDRVPECFGYPIVEGEWAWVRGVHGIASQIDAVVSVLDGQDMPVAPDRHLHLTELAQRVDPTNMTLRMDSLPRGSDDLRAQYARDALSAGYSPGEIYRATLEGTAFSVAGLVHEARQDGADCGRFVVTGAAAGNQLLLSILSAVLKTEIEIGDQEAGLLGAAVLAAVGARVYSNVNDAIEHMIRPGPKVRATLSERRAYDLRQVDLSGRTGAAPGDRTRRRLTF